MKVKSIGGEGVLIPGFSSPGSEERVMQFQPGDVFSATGSSEDCNWISVKNNSPVGGSCFSSSICWIDAGMLEPTYFPCMYTVVHNDDGATRPSGHIRLVERVWKSCSSALKHFCN